MVINDFSILLKHLFNTNSFDQRYRNKPIVNLSDITIGKFPFNGYSVADWECNGVDCIPYVCIISENGADYYNVKLPGKKYLVKLKKKLLKDEFRNLLK